ncbi:MAG TPA: tryptophan--tRNA ligase [Chloroflexota bacterium]|nr:tryptophan--tRNA ligase [Chloroflexota bacterium]
MAASRVVTGVRPTGPLHLGHYVGVLRNWLELQDRYDCHFLLADVQALTTNFDSPARIAGDVREVVLDWLSVGLDPERSTFYLQSRLPQIAELTVFLGMLVPLSHVRRNPTIKSEAEQRGWESDNLTYGFLGYPISQAADIMVVRGDLVPVGEDQLPHVEQTREIVRRFNRVYGDIFPEPQALLGEIPRLPGTDGRRQMGNSLGNAIFLKDSPETVREKVMSMYTDPRRIHATDPGTVEGNPVFIYHDAFNADADEVADLKDRYRTGRVGDIEVKEKLVAAIDSVLEPIRERRRQLGSEPRTVDEAVAAGTERALTQASTTMERVREVMGIAYRFSDQQG